MISWQAAVTGLLDGFNFGFLIFLVAAGLSIMLGLMQVFNLALGAFFMVGGYVGLMVLEATGSWPLAILGGAGIGALLAFVTERYFIRPRLYGRRIFESILLTFAIGIILADLSLFLWTGVPKVMPPPGIFDFRMTISEGWFYPFYRVAERHPLLNLIPR